MRWNTYMYMMQRIKRRCVERCEQKCMAQKIREKRRSQRLFASFSRFLSLFIPLCVDLLAFLELRPHVDVVECQAIQIQANFICHLFRLIFFLLLFWCCCHLGFGYPAKAKVFDTFVVYYRKLKRDYSVSWLCGFSLCVRNENPFYACCSAHNCKNSPYFLTFHRNAIVVNMP